MADPHVQVEFRFGDLELLMTEAPFDKAKAAIEKENGTIATAQQIAQARIVAGPEHHISQHGSWTTENFVYYPNGKILVPSAEYSPILKQAPKATQANREGEEYYLSKKVASNLEKIAKTDKRKSPAKQRVYTLDEKKSYEIPVSKFDLDMLPQFLFKETAPEYARFLQKKTSINKIPVWLTEAKSKPFARALWFHDLDGGSDLGGDFRLLYGYYGVRGVHKFDAKKLANTYETVMQKYNLKSPEQLDKVLEKYTKAKEILQ